MTQVNFVSTHKLFCPNQYLFFQWRGRAEFLCLGRWRFRSLCLRMEGRLGPAHLQKRWVGLALSPGSPPRACNLLRVATFDSLKNKQRKSLVREIS